MEMTATARACDTVMETTARATATAMEHGKGAQHGDGDGEHGSLAASVGCGRR